MTVINIYKAQFTIKFMEHDFWKVLTKNKSRSWFIGFVLNDRLYHS
jgi:hypothetical protein